MIFGGIDNNLLQSHYELLQENFFSWKIAKDECKEKHMIFDEGLSKITGDFT